MSEWETEEEILRSMGNGQYEDYVIISKDEADRRIAELGSQLAEAKTDRQQAWKANEKLLGELAEAREEIEPLRAGYAEAIEDIADWACYADEYFQRKHDLAGTLAKHKAVLAGQGGEG